MKFNKSIFVLFFALAFTVFPINNSFAGHEIIPETDSSAASLYSFFDLRNRETYVQVTNTANAEFSHDIDVSGNITVHVQIFNVDQDCNENNFFDTLTPNDTHIYNMGDIQTNNGTPSGVVLPDNAYGFVVISPVDSSLVIDEDALILIGNFRILDNSGYEYRTNSGGLENFGGLQPDDDTWYFNFNTNAGITLSDVIAITVDQSNTFSTSAPNVEVNILDSWWLFDVNIYDLNEVAFSCRNVIFSCVDQDNPLLEALLEESGDANVASFEYGINNSIPHSKGGELLCPGNTINEGIVRLQLLNNDGDISAYFIGLNNGNGRGSMDFWWSEFHTNILPSSS